jgi:hypothetical protein
MMWDLIAIVFIGLLAYFSAVAETEIGMQKRCEAKYADMPHNQVTEHCKKILRFEK